jgi:general secretion pathway protein D
VVLTGPPAQINALKSIIRQLDIRRAQVLVESIIAEVNVELSRQLGVEFAHSPGKGGSGPVALSNFEGSEGTSLVDIIASVSGGELTTSPGTGLFLGAAGLSGGLRFAFLLRALDSDTATNILSTPTLVTMDNEEAKIEVGQEVPFRTGTFTTSADTSTNPFTTIERQKVGITLNITPQINEGDTIKLELEQKADQLEPTAQQTAGAADLITKTREIKTTVMVENDQILVLGGLMQNDYQDGVSKVPLLGDIPILGRLFRFDDTSNSKRNLMVFIHPVILKDEATATAYTGEKYSYLRARQLEAELDKRGLIQNPAAQLPDLDELIVKVPEHKRAPSSNTDLDAFIDIE